ncbi:glycosyltransferase [Pedobacter sp. P351]|uniref:glycosyltransferase n=1 Tax=Pedobacter superstes TaxID=3133441 RepID=UPI0030A48D6F
MKSNLFFVINTLEGGGAERVLTNLANYFHEKGYRVYIVCLNYAPASYKPSPGIKVVYLVNRKDSSGFFYRLLYGGMTFFNLLRLLARERPKCVVSFMTSANLWTGLTCSILRIPYLVSERITPDYTINSFNYIYKCLSYIIYKHAKAIVIPAKGMIASFKKNRLFRSLNNFKTIHNPVNLFASNFSSQVYPRKYILAVGRLDPQKGFDILINAFSKLRDLDIDLLISGEGKERSNIVQLIESLNLTDRVKLIGFKNNIQDYYKQAEVFVLSSRNEGYPNALVEAMSLGCSCIATNCEFGPSEIIINQDNGILVEPVNVHELATAILDLLTNPILKRRISENAKLINKSNSLETISLKWEKLILSHGLNI